MSKKTILIVTILFCLSLASYALSEPPAGKIIIGPDGKKPVTFDHAAHVAKEADCRACHHKDEKGKEQKCSTCHLSKDKDETPKAKTIFHKQCGGCHTKLAKGPQYPKATDCKLCHVKK